MFLVLGFVSTIKSCQRQVSLYFSNYGETKPTFWIVLFSISLNFLDIYLFSSQITVACHSLRYVSLNLLSRYCLDVTCGYLGSSPETGLMTTSSSGLTNSAMDCLADLRLNSSWGMMTRWRVEGYSPPDRVSSMSPTLTMMDPGNGLASVQSPSTFLTSRPPSWSWNRRVMVP